MLKNILPMLLLATGTGLAQAQPQPVAQLQSVTTYLAEFDKVEQASSKVSLEPLFAAAEAAQTALMQVNGDDAYLESLSDVDYAALKAQLRGIALHRGGEIYAQPDGRVLQPLAVAHGRAEDIAYFRLYRQLWGENLFPIYLKQLSQPSPCVRLGVGVIPKLYESWQRYAHAYPKAYTTVVQQNIRDFEETLAEGVCACGDANSVLTEQRSFLKLYPQAPKAAQIRARMQQLKSDPDARPVRCQ